MVRLAMVPEIQGLISDRDQAIAQQGLAARLDQVEIDGLNSMVFSLKAANQLLEKEVERLRRSHAALVLEMSYNSPVPRIGPSKMGFLAKLKDLFLNS